MTGDHGLAGEGRERVLPLVTHAWDAFMAAARSIDPQTPTRLTGWRAHDLCVHLGVWADRHLLADVIASARSGGGGPVPDIDAANAAVVAAHRNASPHEVMAALERSRDAVERYFADPDHSLDLATTMSFAGPLPLLSVAMGQAYELAVHALDLAAAGATAPSDEALDAGVAALTEIIGALASRNGIDGTVSLLTPAGGWGLVARGAAGWSVAPTGPHTPGPALAAEAAVLLEVSSGRLNPAVAVARRRLRLVEAPALLAFAPIIESTPGIPGAPLMSVAARTLSSTGSLFRRLRLT